MLLIVIKNLIQDRTRLAISILGAAFAVVLIVSIVGIYDTIGKTFTQFTRQNPADVFIAKEGVNDYFHGVSILQVSDLNAIANEVGVIEVVPMIMQKAVLKADGKNFDTFIASFDPSKSLGKAWNLTSGTNDINENQIIIPDVVAKQIDKKVGDELELSGETFTIGGLATEASILGTNYAWVTLEKAQQMTKTTDIANFAYVTVEPGETSQVVQGLREKYPAMSILTKDEFIVHNRAVLEESFLPIIAAVAVIAVVIGTIVVGITIYTATTEKAREYGILKAIGLSNRQLYVIVLLQTLIISGLGLVVGLLLSVVLGVLLEKFILLKPEIGSLALIQVTILMLAMSLVASLIPLRRLISIDPAEVFKA